MSDARTAGAGVLLLGDSHLARVRRALPAIGADVVNRAVGGAVAGDLDAQARGLDLAAFGAVVLSIGTNDAAPWRGLPADRVVVDLVAFLDSHRARWVYVESPTVPALSLGDAVRERGGVVVPTRDVLAALGERALAPDGLHLTGAAYGRLLPAIAEAVGEVARP